MTKGAIWHCLVGALGYLDITILLSALGKLRHLLLFMDNLEFKLGSFNLVLGTSMNVLDTLGQKLALRGHHRSYRCKYMPLLAGTMTFDIACFKRQGR